MKTKLLIIACLLLAGCTEKPTYEQANAVKEKYPGCELRDAQTINAAFYVRTPDGMVRMVILSNATQGIASEWVLFGPTNQKPATP